MALSVCEQHPAPTLVHFILGSPHTSLTPYTTAAAARSGRPCCNSIKSCSIRHHPTQAENSSPQHPTHSAPLCSKAGRALTVSPRSRQDEGRGGEDPPLQGTISCSLVGKQAPSKTLHIWCRRKKDDAQSFLQSRGESTEGPREG